MKLSKKDIDLIDIALRKYHLQAAFAITDWKETPCQRSAAKKLLKSKRIEKLLERLAHERR
jgi:hypothetical protein